MYPFIARNLLYYPTQALRGEKIGQFLAEVRAFDRLDRGEMEKVQWTKLKALLDYTYAHNRYYRDLFDTNDLAPGKIKSWSDFQKMPFLAKSTLRQNPDALISDVSLSRDHRKTSGSTGMPLTFVKDRDAQAFMNAVMHEVYGWHGIEVGDRNCRIWAIPKGPKKQLRIFIRDRLQNRRRLNSFDVSDQSSIAFFNAMRKFHPKFMMGVPSYITDFAKRLTNAGLNPADMGLKVIISTGEILYPAQRELMKKSFACTIANEYGTTECGIIAFECPHGSMHLMTQALLVEVVNPITGTPCKVGEPGEIVITELHGRLMPFIRYRLGDTITLSPKSCSCGMQLPCVEHVEGRLEDMIMTPDGRKVAGGMLYYTLTEGIHQFKAFQRAPDRLEVFIVKGPGFSEAWLEGIKKQWTDYLGPLMKFDFRFVDHIPADPSGKLRYFVPEFDPEYTKATGSAGSSS